MIRGFEILQKKKKPNGAGETVKQSNIKQRIRHLTPSTGMSSLNWLLFLLISDCKFDRRNRVYIMFLPSALDVNGTQ